MYTRDHLLLSVVVGSLVVLVGATPLSPAVAVAAAVVAGTAIDVDHFVVARLRTGSWRAARGAIRHPRRLLFDQDAIFAEGEVGVLHRLLSHALLAGVVVGALAVLAPAAVLVVGLSIYVHVVTDLVWDTALVARVEKRDTDRPLRELVR
ncbi:MAG: hypothetical protein ABEI75_00870 [Halobaculum sp.]